MMVQHLKRRPLSRYLKDFKHSQTHCAHCRKLLDRITLVRDGKIVNKIEISRLDTLLDENGWQTEQKSPEIDTVKRHHRLILDGVFLA